jgi:predicted dehydrogenase
MGEQDSATSTTGTAPATGRGPVGGVIEDGRPIRVGLIGLGAMGRHHARVIRAVEGMELVAVADPVGDRHGVAGDLPVLPDVHALIEAGLDAAMVAVPTYLHEQVALALAQAGVHTMVEKPIAATVEEGERVAEAFARAGLVGCVGYVERCNPALLAMRERIEAGQLGTVYQITTSRQGPFPARIADVGVVKDLATHDIDLTAWIARSSYVQVSAQTTHRTGREHEDMVLAVARLANGTIVNHIVNWLSPRKVRETVAVGENGAFIANTLTGDLTFVANGTVPTQWDPVSQFRGVSEGDAITYALTKREPLLVEQENFRDRLWGRPSQAVTMDEGVQTLRVVEAVLDAARTGTTITL